jgi:hypothetical protein
LVSKKTQRLFNNAFKLNKASLYLWIAIIVFSIGYVIVISELDNILTYILPIPKMLRGVSDILYTITMEYRNFIPIMGFNERGIIPIEFQPLRLDIAGLVIL